MTTLNRNNSNWSFEERRKINENWAILEGLANSTASGNNGLKSEVDQLKITVGQNTNRITNSIQLSNQANIKSDSALTSANTALFNSNEAKKLAEGIDGKVNQANSKSDNAVLRANEAKEKSEYVQSQLDSVVADGDSSAEVVQARKGKTTLRERLDDEYNALTAQLDQTAPKDRNAFAAKTFGRFETGAVLASIANEENPRPQVVGIETPKELSKVISRDSVSHYVSNKGVSPTLDVLNNTTYTINTVTVPVALDLSQLEIGMIIDTKHTPYSFVGIIKSINGNVIEIEDGWYETKEGIGSENPSLPSDNVGFIANNVRKIWGVNNNVLLPPDKATNMAVGEEMGLFNGKPFESSNVGGFDLVNFNGKVHYGFKVRRSPNSTGGFLQAFRVESSDQAFVNVGVNATDILLAGFLNGENTNTGFYIRNDGAQSKLKLRAAVHSNGVNAPIANDFRLLIINKTARETLTIIDPANRGGELLFVVNNSAVPVDLVCQSGGRFNHNGLQLSTIAILPRTSLILASDNSAYHILSGSLEIDRQVRALVGSNNPTNNLTPLFVGQEYIDTANKVAYKACGLTSADWKQITN